jgi:hypothetical protein
MLYGLQGGLCLSRRDFDGQDMLTGSLALMPNSGLMMMIRAIAIFSDARSKHIKQRCIGK